MAERGFVHVEDTRARARERAVELWDEGRRRVAAEGRDLGEFLLLVDGSNFEVDDLNERAPARRLEAGELGETAVVVTTWNERQHVLREEHLRTADRVVFQRAHRPHGEPWRVENGERGLVTGVDEEAESVTVAVRHREVTLSDDDVKAVRLGYAQHVYTAQGRTVDEAYVVTGGWQADRASSYVGVSRARNESHLISDYSSLETERGDRDAALVALGSRFSTGRDKAASLSLERDRARDQVAAFRRRGERAVRGSCPRCRRGGAPCGAGLAGGVGPPAPPAPGSRARPRHGPRARTKHVALGGSETAAG